jgi:hypothetical protein
MGIDKLLTKLSSECPPVRYRKMTLYVSPRLALLFRKAAIKDGFRLVDFARVLVTLGLTVTLLSLDEAWITRASKRALLGQLGEAGKRGYTYRGMGRSGVWVSVCLPVGVLGLVGEVTRSSGWGRNEALQSFLQLSRNIPERQKNSPGITHPS